MEIRSKLPAARFGYTLGNRVDSGAYATRQQCNRIPDEINAINYQDKILDFESFTSDISQHDF